MCGAARGSSVADMKILVPAALASVAVGMALPAGADASWPGLNGRVSLTQRVPAGAVRANRDIFAYPLGTDAAAARRRLTTSTNNEEQSSWSPDGQWIAFKQLDDVWVVRWDGTGLKQLTDFPADLNNTQPSWSADGSQIIFRSNFQLHPANIADIWVMNADGTNRHKLVTREGDERYPSMSPDGRKLLFRGDWDGVSGNGDEEIFTADADGSDQTRLTFNDVEDSSPNWSPDGSRIALQTAVDGVNQEIFVMDADGSHRVRLTNDARFDIGPTWSPDGRMIAFTRAATPDDPGDIWVMDADGSNQRPLTSTDVIEESPDWQPIPALAGLSGERDACGDRSLEPGGIASIVAIGVKCAKALRVAERWSAGENPEGYRCTEARHSMDQSAVTCSKPGEGHERHTDALAFVVRDPAVATVLGRAAAEPETADQPPEVEELEPDDALPRPEED
jgi:Tol biopolymer transport system component